MLYIRRFSVQHTGILSPPLSRFTALYMPLVLLIIEWQLVVTRSYTGQKPVSYRRYEVGSARTNTCTSSRWETRRVGIVVAVCTSSWLGQGLQ
ncbi:uncharacterized protein YALI1_B19877g [Yarrowia lipolytica]|uniref:Uncharacterized protein n=1 Tax=Yarrowia lipolytica TaxID=4952 RepID=A0A1D8N7V9_YARLL|nr:hypothetical protein YALI1_B19877g [Yarrowia lipolytica]